MWSVAVIVSAIGLYTTVFIGVTNRVGHQTLVDRAMKIKFLAHGATDAFVNGRKVVLPRLWSAAAPCHESDSDSSISSAVTFSPFGRLDRIGPLGVC